jgi:HD-GYP domain-containing protein (c-di-GMP phosphodiesterase class II)
MEGRGTHFDPVLTDVFEQVADQFQGAAETRPANSNNLPVKS